MKLLNKTMLYFLLAMIPVLAAGGYLLFKTFANQLNERTDKELVYEEVQWIQYLEAATANGSNFILRSPDLLIAPAQQEPFVYPVISTTYGMKARESIQIPFRQLQHIVNINGVPYQILIRKSQEQRLALVSSITSIMLVVFAGLFAATLIFIWIINQQLWRPFQLSLQKIRKLELQKIEGVKFGETDIEEFNALNSSLNTMTRKIHGDYVSMKEFTENAAHEMQTPLAVAQTKLELLLQSENLTESQVQTIAQATDSLSRLSKLNQSLLLLAKIENNQYKAEEEINLAEVTEKYLRLFDEMIKDKQLTVKKDKLEAYTVRMHTFLADSLVSNLLGNAIKYNSQNGEINIQISNEKYCIGNTSNGSVIDEKQLFKRFSANTENKESSTGLGLAIVKKIVETNGLTISYHHHHEMHWFCVTRK